MGERLWLSGRGFVGGFCNSETDLLKEPIAKTYCRNLLLGLITGTYYWGKGWGFQAGVWWGGICNFESDLLKELIKGSR